MRLQALLLLVVGSSTLTFAAPLGSDNDEMEHRQKRAALSIMAGWKSILKSALGSTWQLVNGRYEKVYFKKGTMWDASGDFYTLGPQKVKMGDGSMVGKRGDQEFTVEREFETGPLRASLRLRGDGISGRRTIIYVDDPAKSDTALRQWLKHGNRLSSFASNNFRRIIRKTDICICKNKNADHLCGDRMVFGITDQVWHKPGWAITEAGQRLEIPDLGRYRDYLTV